MKKITITIDKIGRPKIEADGFVGGSCLEATKPILDAFSDSSNSCSIVEKPEMWLPSEESNVETEGV